MCRRLRISTLLLCGLFLGSPVWADGGSDSSSATLITGTPFFDPGNTQGKGNDALLPSCLSGGDDTAEDAWYRLDLANSAMVTLWTACADTGAASYDTRLAVFDSTLGLITCNDDAPDCGLPFGQSLIADLALAAGTYFMVVDGWSGASGPYALQVRWIEDPVPCTGGSDSTAATQIAVFPSTLNGTTVGACDDILLDCQALPGTSGEDVWYSVSLGSEVLLNVSTRCETLDLDTRVAVLDHYGTPLFCNDDDPSCPTGQSKIENAYLPPGDYYIVVESAESSGTFTLEADTTSVVPGAIFDLLPDIIVDETSLQDYDFVDFIEPGRTHIRFATAAPNIGVGTLYFYGVEPDNGDGTQDVRQRIWRSDGSFYDRKSGAFVFHPNHEHVHLQDWAQFRLREVLPGDGVGPIVVEGDKISFCIADLVIYDDMLPGFDPVPRFTTCASTVQGISVGWSDVYGKSLLGQNLEITLVPDGVYWLEATVDPDGVLVEADETNNVGRVQVTIGNPGPIAPDTYEPNDTADVVDLHREGGPNSPNLGPVGPQRVLSGLNIHALGKDDLFRFYMPATGGPGDFVRIDFVHQQGNLDLELLDEARAVLSNSNSMSNAEQIELSGFPAGWYYVRVHTDGTATNPEYTLTLDPSANTPPSVVVLRPPAGVTPIHHAVDAYAIAWEATDPEMNEMWVTISVNTQPQLDGNEIPLSTSVNTPAAYGVYVLNSAEVPVGEYYVYCSITDGGGPVGSWSEGTLLIADDPTEVPPAEGPLRLHRNIPNPFNPVTLLRLSLDVGLSVHWGIYDSRGIRVRTLEDGWLAAGEHLRKWNGADQNGHFVASGVYLNVVSAEGRVYRQKITLLR